MVAQFIDLEQFKDSRGSLIPLDGIPFEIQRVYCVLAPPGHAVTRGNHAHRRAQQVFVCLSGESGWILDDAARTPTVSYEVLTSPNRGLVVPPMVWHSFTLSAGGIILALASEAYDEEEYIRDFEEWKSLIRSGT